MSFLKQCNIIWISKYRATISIVEFFVLKKQFGNKAKFNFLITFTEYRKKG